MSTTSRRPCSPRAARDGEAPPIAAIPRRYRLEYAAAADAGMSLTDVAWRDADGTWAYRLAAADGTELFRAAIGPPGATT